MADIIINIQGQADAAVSSIDQVINRLNTLSSTLNSVAQQAQSTFASIGNVQPQGMIGFQMALNGLSQQLTDLQNQINAVANQTGNLGRQMTGATGAMTQTRHEVRETSSSFQLLGKSAGNAGGFLGKLFKSIGRIAFYRLLRTAIKEVTKAFSEGLKAAYEFSKRTGGMLAPALDKITSAANQMKGQLGAALGGLLTAIAPILITIINLVTRAANAITQLFAILNGSGLYKRATEQMNEFGEAAGGAGGKVKGLLAAWDELNVIGNESGGGGGGGGDLSDGMFEWAEVDSDWAKLFASGDFFAMGDKVAEGLVNVSKIIADFFDKIDKWNYGEKFAQFLNGVFSDPAKWSEIGANIGKSVSSLFNEIYGFIDTFDVAQAAKSIASSINSFFGNINATQIGTALGTAVLNVFDFLLELVADTDWASIAESILEIYISWIDKLASNPGRLVAGVVKVAISIVQAVVDVILFMLQKIAEKLDEWGLDFLGLKDKLADAREWVSETADSWKESSSEAITGFFNNAENKVGEWKGAVKEHFDGATDSATQFADTSSAEIDQCSQEAKSSVLSSVEEIANSIKGNASDVANTLTTETQSCADAMSGMFGNIASAVDTVVGKIASVASAIGKIPSNKTVKINYEYNNAPASTTTSYPTQYAEGGYVSTGELFVAREAGPELVGSIGSHTAVANNDQIVAGISSGVQSANSEQNELLRQQNGILLKLLDKQLTISPSAALGQVVARSSALYARN